MWISTALASETTALEGEAPSMADAFFYNAAFIFLVVVLFYLIFIRPQTKRMNEHVAMLNSLNEGDRVVTGGGLVGKVSKIVDDKEVEIELAKDVKVIALKSTLLEKPEPPSKTANREATKDKKQKD